MAAEIDNGMVLLDILKSVTRIEAMLCKDKEEEEDKEEDGGEQAPSVPDPEIQSFLLENLDSLPGL